MNSSQLYLNIHHILAPKGSTIIYPEDHGRKLSIHRAYNSGENLSHITLEFDGIRAKYFSCLTFDGTGDSGVGVHSFAMPRIKMDGEQKALVFLSIMQYLIECCAIVVDFEFFLERAEFETQSSAVNLRQTYKGICAFTSAYLDSEGSSKSIAKGFIK